MIKTRPYVYKITFKCTGHYYIGVRFQTGCHKSELGVKGGYFTSSKFVQPLFKAAPHFWEILILKEGSSEEVIQFETEQLHKNINSPLCLNENVAGAVSLNGCKKGGRTSVQRGSGIHALSKKQLAKQGKMTAKQGIGCHGLSPEKQRERSKRGGRTAGYITLERRIGIHGLSKKQRVRNARKAGKATAKMRREKGDPFAKPIYCLKLGIIFPSASCAEKVLGLKPGSQKGISHCVRGERLSAYGYQWTIVQELEKMQKEVERLSKLRIGKGGHPKKIK